MTLPKDPNAMSIPAPQLPAFHRGRRMECQDALSSATAKLMDDAEAAGWTIAEITVALVEIADSVMLQEVDVEETNFYLRDLLARKRRLL